MQAREITGRVVASLHLYNPDSNETRLESESRR